MNFRANVTTLGRRLILLPIHCYKKLLPLLQICITVVLVGSFWWVNLLAYDQYRTHVSTQKNNSLSDSTFLHLHTHRTKLLSTDICPQDSLFLLILVSTNVGNFDRRHLIRKTWGADYSIETKWKTVFLLGKNNNGKQMINASKESRIYGDIVQGDYQEHFWNMSYKVAMGFEWAVKYCRFYYLLKADDDVFVNIFGLMNFLTKYTTPMRRLYTGNIMVGSVVLRNGRYGVSPEEYNRTVYKPYISGGGYILSRDVVEKFSSSFNVLNPLKIDDAYIGVLADQAGIKPIHNKEFRMYANKCEYRESTLVQHPARGECAKKLYNKMMETIDRSID